MNLKYLFLLLITITMYNLNSIEKESENDIPVQINCHICKHSKNGDCRFDMCLCPTEYIEPFEISQRATDDDIKMHVLKRLKFNDYSKIGIFRMPNSFLVRVVRLLKIK